MKFLKNWILYCKSHFILLYLIACYYNKTKTIISATVLMEFNAFIRKQENKYNEIAISPLDY